MKKRPDSMSVVFSLFKEWGVVAQPICLNESRIIKEKSEKNGCCICDSSNVLLQTGVFHEKSFFDIFLPYSARTTTRQQRKVISTAMFWRWCCGGGHHTHNTQRERCKVVVVLLLLAMVSVGRHVTTHARERYEGAMRGLAKLVAR